MYPQYPYAYYPYDTLQFQQQNVLYQDVRQQTVSGTATWTEGGQITKCGIPWSDNLYMTAAVSNNSQYRCGQTLQIGYPVTGRSVLVEIVDQVSGYPNNRLNLHHRVFEALGANPQQGVIDIQIKPITQMEQQQWGDYLLRVIQTAYPNYNVTSYSQVDKSEESASRISETYEYSLQSDQNSMTVQATVVYDPTDNRIKSLNINET